MDPVLDEQQMLCYCKEQLKMIQVYYEFRRSAGDSRDKQIIVNEWIDNHAHRFRAEWFEHHGRFLR
jgi:hypothetical protein